MSIKNKRTISGIGMVALFATGGSGNIFTAFVLMTISLTCLYLGKAFDRKTWE